MLIVVIDTIPIISKGVDISTFFPNIWGIISVLLQVWSTVSVTMERYLTVVHPLTRFQLINMYTNIARIANAVQCHS